MIFATHQHESAIGMHMSPSSWMPPHLPLHSFSLVSNPSWWLLLSSFYMWWNKFREFTYLQATLLVSNRNGILIRINLTLSLWLLCSAHTCLGASGQPHLYSLKCRTLELGGHFFLSLCLSQSSFSLSHLPSNSFENWVVLKGLTLLFLYVPPRLKKSTRGDFPGGPVVKTAPPRAGCAGLILGLGARIPHVWQP